MRIVSFTEVRNGLKAILDRVVNDADTTVIFFILADRWYVPIEEKAMQECFGNQYKEYQARTRRWI